MEIISIGGYFYMEKFEELKEFFLERKYLIIMGGVFVLIFVLGIYLIFNNTNNNHDVVLEEDVVLEQEKNDDVECNIKVDIKGEIKSPGLYELKCDDRVLDVINLAGGLTKKADTSMLNLSKKVKDEMVIIILSKDQVNNYEKEVIILEEKLEGCNNDIKNDACIKNEDIYVSENETDIGVDNSNGSNNSTNEDIIGDTPVNSLISINNATLEELMTLSGIGKTKAESIIKYRNENGGFKTLEELKNVKGIGDSTFEKIKANITL